MKEHMQLIPPPQQNAEPPKVNYSVKADLTDPDTRALFEKMYQLQPTAPPVQPEKKTSGNKQPEKITGEQSGRYPVS